MSDILFLEYPKCSTCQKAKKWLEENHVKFACRHIVENNPGADELKAWAAVGNKPLKSFFNTSGLMYKSLGLKDKLAVMDENAQLKALSSHGMLVKRPLLVGSDFVLTGFREAEWQKILE